MDESLNFLSKALNAEYVSSPASAFNELLFRLPKPLTASANSFAAATSTLPEPDVELEDELLELDDELLELEDELEAPGVL